MECVANIDSMKDGCSSQRLVVKKQTWRHNKTWLWNYTLIGVWLTSR